MPTKRKCPKPQKLDIADWDALSASVRRIEAIALLLAPMAEAETKEPLQRCVVEEAAMIIFEETTRIRTVLRKG